MNNEQSLRALDLAKAATASGDIDKARRLLEKAVRLDAANAQARHLLDVLNGKKPASSSSSSTKKPASAASSSSSRPPRPTSTPSPASTTATPTSSSSQTAIVQEILGAKDHYGVLGVARGASDAQLKAAYRRRALAVHPDKCPGAEATEAFKKVSHAYSILSDAQERAYYDRTGEDKAAAGAGGGAHPFARGFGGGGGRPMTPEELFAAFFGGGAAFEEMFGGGGRGGGGHSFHHYGGGGGGGGLFNRRRGRQGGGGDGGGARRQHPNVHVYQASPLTACLMTAAPFLLFFLITFGASLSHVFRAPPLFSLAPTRTHNVQHTTGDATRPRNLPFYAARSALADAARAGTARARVYQDVYYAYVARCDDEQRALLRAMRYDMWRGHYVHTRASRSLRTTACDALGVALPGREDKDDE